MKYFLFLIMTSTILTGCSQNWEHIKEINGEFRLDRIGKSIGFEGNGKEVFIVSTKQNQLRTYTNYGNVWKNNSHDFPNEIPLEYPVTNNKNGDIVAISAYRDNRNGNESGSVYILKKNINNSWDIIGDIQGQEEGIQFGKTCNLSNDGKLIAISSHYSNDSTKIVSYFVSIYKYEKNKWLQVGNSIKCQNSASFKIGRNNKEIFVIDSEEINYTTYTIGRRYQIVNGEWKNFGENLILNNCYPSNISCNESLDIIALGMPNKNLGNDLTAAGQVIVYQFIDNKWQQKGQIINGDNRIDYLGSSVSLNESGSILLIGANNGKNLNKERTGYVKVFKFSEEKWMPLGNTIYGKNKGDSFGYSVKINTSGDCIAVGACSANNELGSVNVYELR